VRVQAALGEDHKDTITIMDNLAVAHVAAGSQEKAIALHQAAIARSTPNWRRPSHHAHHDEQFGACLPGGRAFERFD